MSVRRQSLHSFPTRRSSDLNLDSAFEQALRWKPRVISMAAEADAVALRSRLKKEGLGEIEVVHGAGGAVRVATHAEVDFVVSADRKSTRLNSSHVEISYAVF